MKNGKLERTEKLFIRGSLDGSHAAGATRRLRSN